MAVPEAPLDAPPLSRPVGATPAELAGRLGRGVRGLSRRPGALRVRGMGPVAPGAPANLAVFDLAATRTVDRARLAPM
jgi:hypothetical protein